MLFTFERCFSSCSKIKKAVKLKTKTQTGGLLMKKHETIFSCYVFVCWLLIHLQHNLFASNEVDRHSSVRVNDTTVMIFIWLMLPTVIRGEHTVLIFGKRRITSTYRWWLSAAFASEKKCENALATASISSADSVVTCRKGQQVQRQRQTRLGCTRILDFHIKTRRTNLEVKVKDR